MSAAWQPEMDHLRRRRERMAEGLDGRCGMSECEECGACIAVHDATAILRGES